MSATAEKTRTEWLNVRVTSDQARLIRRAATATKANLSSFLVESACLRAEEALASQQHFCLYREAVGCLHRSLESSSTRQAAAESIAQQTEHPGKALEWPCSRKSSH